MDKIISTQIGGIHVQMPPKDRHAPLVLWECGYRNVPQDHNRPPLAALHAHWGLNNQRNLGVRLVP